jgi:hypothetical protein
MRHLHQNRARPAEHDGALGIDATRDRRSSHVASVAEVGVRPDARARLVVCQIGCWPCTNEHRQHAVTWCYQRMPVAWIYQLLTRFKPFEDVLSCTRRFRKCKPRALNSKEFNLLFPPPRLDRAWEHGVPWDPFQLDIAFSSCYTHYVRPSSQLVARLSSSLRRRD